MGEGNRDCDADRGEDCVLEELLLDDPVEVDLLALLLELGDERDLSGNPLSLFGDLNLERLLIYKPNNEGILFFPAFRLPSVSRAFSSAYPSV